MRRCMMIAAVAAAVWACGSGAYANVTIATVPVGDPGNAGELSGAAAGGYGPYRICGAVGYTYNIGKYEVTAGQYTEFLNSVAGVDAYRLYSTSMWSSTYGCKIQRSGGGIVGNPYTYAVASAFANRPVNYVSWGSSARFTNWLHNGQPTGSQGLPTTEDGAYFLNGATTEAQLVAVNRKTDARWAITTEDEWYKAAYYKSGSTNAGYWDYPTGSDSTPGRDMADVSGNNADYYNGSGPYPIDSSYYTTVAGEFQNSDSPYGTFDQGGNVWEWNETADGSFRGYRGGAFSTDDYNLRAANRYSSFPTGVLDGLIGFRVVEVPEPSTSVLLVSASMGILRRRRA
jgi:formylglycine-generating enzyme